MRQDLVSLSVKKERQLENLDRFSESRPSAVVLGL